MENSGFTRRHALKVTAVFGIALMAGIEKVSALPVAEKTPPLSAAKISAIETALGKKGVYKEAEFTHTTPLPRNDLKIKIKGEAVPIPFGFGGWVAFAGKHDDAHIAGDIAMLQSEVNDVIRIIRKNNMEVVAVHNHMLDDDPHMIFLHYYGRGHATTLAQGFRAALDVLGKKKEKHMQGMKM